MKLYDLTGEYQQLRQMAEDESLPPDALADTLEGIAGEIEEKAEAICIIIKELQAEADAIKAEKDKLSDRQKAVENRADSLKNYLLAQLLLVDMKRIKTPRILVSVRAASPKLRIEDEKRLIAWAEENCRELVRVKAPELDRTALRQAYKNGKHLPGVTAIDQKVLVIQ